MAHNSKEDDGPKKISAEEILAKIERGEPVVCNNVTVEGNLDLFGLDSAYECVWFSISTAATPGYAMFHPNGFYQLVSGIEAIFGTFLWAAFIATFARKWMR
ncbi:MAG: ion channel [Methanotrichaceae archaeon]